MLIFLIISILTGVSWIFSLWFWFTFLCWLVMSFRHLFMYLWFICMFSLKKCLVRISLNCFVVAIVVIELYKFFICFRCWRLTRYMICKYFFSFSRLSLQLCWWHPFLYRALQSTVVSLVHFCICCLCFLCQVQEIITKTNVRELTTYILFFKFYGFIIICFMFDLFTFNFTCLSPLSIQMFTTLRQYSLFHSFHSASSKENPSDLLSHQYICFLLYTYLSLFFSKWYNFKTI